MNNINFRIKQLVEYFANGNNSTFGQMIGVNEANIRNYIAGTEPKFNIIEKIASQFEINFEWLLLGKGEMSKMAISSDMMHEVTFENKVPQVITVDSHSKDNIVMVPHSLKAGYIEGFNDPKFIKKLPSYRLPGMNNGVFRMFEVEGNSMRGTIPNKSIAVGQFVENWIEDVKDNQVYAVISNEVEDGFIKRVVNRIEKYDNLICKSDNRKNYPNQNINPSAIKEIWHIKAALIFEFPDPADIYDRLNDLEANYAQIMKMIEIK